MHLSLAMQRDENIKWNYFGKAPNCYGQKAIAIGRYNLILLLVAQSRNGVQESCPNRWIQARNYSYGQAE